MLAGHRVEAAKMDCALTPSDACVLSGSEDGELLGPLLVFTPLLAVHGRKRPRSGFTAAHPYRQCGATSMRQSKEFSSCKRMRPVMGSIWLAGRVCYWDLVEETMLESFQAHKSYVCSLAMHPDGTLLLTSSTDGTVKVWY